MTRTLSTTPVVDDQPRSWKLFWWLVALVVLAGAGVAVAKYFGGSPGDDKSAARAATASEWYTVKRQSFDLTVLASGELEATNQVEIRSEVQGESVIVFIVEEGTAVKPGDLLVKLSDDKLLADIEEESLQVEAAQSAHIAAQQALAIKESEAVSTNAAAELKVELARLDLQKWQEGELVQKRNELKLALETAQRTLARTGQDLELSKELYADSFISRSELETDELEYIEAQAALETAILDQQVYEEFTYPKEMKQFNSDLEQAKAELERTLRQNESELAQKRADLESKARQLEIRQDRLAKLKQQQAATEIRAPQEGLVVYATSVGRSRRDQVIQQGSTVHYNSTIILLPDTRKMTASLRVHEAMVPLVRIGQPVATTIDARRGRPMNGQVAQVAPMAEDGGWWNPQLREYAVKVQLPEQPPELLKPAMRCQGEILLGRVEEALAVPVQAVHTEGNQRYCYIPAGGGHVRRAPVTIGKASETLVEITDGLNEGDRVLLRRPQPGELVEN